VLSSHVCFIEKDHLTADRDVQFQYRPSNCASNHSRYPLTFNQRVAQGDLYREAAERLKASLRSIEDLYASTHVEGHSGSSECELCAEKGRRIKQVYYDYYLGNQPGRWDEGLVNYREDLEALFSRSDFPLDVIHARFKRELKDHFRKDMYTVLPTDSPELAEQKVRLDHYFRDTPIEVALEKCFHDKITTLAAVPGSHGEVGRANILDPTHPAGLFIALQKAQTTDQRGHLYSAYYCSSLPSDTPQQRNLKAKYAKLFESGTSHDAVLEMWRSEAKELKARDVEQLEQRLVELKMAQNAHLKNMKKKMMKEDAKLMDKKDMVECSLPSCNNQMDKSKGGVDECGLCLWLSRKSRERRRFFYCSEDHCEEHFVSC
jgi:hypothetical protein